RELAPLSLHDALPILANTDQQYVVTALEIIKHYVQFRLRTDLAPEVWHPAHAKITDMTASHQAPPWDFEQIFAAAQRVDAQQRQDRKSTRLNSSHVSI